MGDFFQKSGEGLGGFPKSNICGRSYAGIFSTNLEKGFAWISKKQYWQAETIMKFCENFGEGLRGFPKSNIGRRKLWGNFSRDWEKLFAWISKKQIWKHFWQEEVLGEFVLEIWRVFSRIAKKQSWREETMGDFF